MQEVKIIKAIIPKFSWIYLVPLSDLHWDEPQCDREAIRGYVNWIAEHDNAYTLLNGDLWTMATKTSTPDFFEYGEPGEKIELMTPDVTLNELEDLLKPISKRILAVCSGGHELKNMFRVTGGDYTYLLMKRLGIEERYSRDGGVLQITTKPLNKRDNIIFNLVYTHGWGSARTRGAKVRKLEYLSSAIHADCYIMSHDHTQNLTRDNYLMPPEWDRPNMGVHRKLLVATGAFRGYGGYPLRSGYQPTDMGTPRIRIDKKLNEDGSIRKDIHASI